MNFTIILIVIITFLPNIESAYTLALTAGICKKSSDMTKEFIQD